MKMVTSMRSLFDDLEPEVKNINWHPEPPPERIPDEIELNVESTGLDWWNGALPIGITIGWQGFSRYLPFAHHGGGNLDEAVVKRWAQEQLRGKHIRNINTKIDIHWLYNWGVDLEAQNNTVSDVGHYAALLDDHRKRFSLDILIQEILGETPISRVDERYMQRYHAGEVAKRAAYQVQAVRKLADVFWPQLTKESLQGVRALEDQVIYPVCEMERNGSPIDVNLLDRWLVKSKREVDRLLSEIMREMSFAVNPDSPKDMERVFKKLGLPIVRTAPTKDHPNGQPSFTTAILKRIEHPTIKKIHRCGKLLSLRSKFLVNTAERVGSDGILRYALHQLRAAKDPNGESGEAGTITGRFSSTELSKDPPYGVNIQQRMKAARQRLSFGFEEDDDSHDDEIFLLRKLHIAARGYLLSSDMDQAQYRIFASYAGNEKVIAAYQANPNLSFHEFMHETIRPFVTDLSYRGMKDTNFAKLFGAKIIKLAIMLGHITLEQGEEIRASKNYKSPLLDRTYEVEKIYNREVPEVEELLEQASHLAKPACDKWCRNSKWSKKFHKEKLPHRGYVKTMLGRRTRFPDGWRLHKAFNAIDQGTEADYMKTKLVELHRERKTTHFTLRITNHDEVVGDIPDVEHAKMVDEILNMQSFAKHGMRVPLTWSTEIGPNWADTHGLEE
jgi:DNA polymerase I-like protein with 3'-5' exonuclease and polymerase domains